MAMEVSLEIKNESEILNAVEKKETRIRLLKKKFKKKDRVDVFAKSQSK